jgi:hypothetical protein
MAGNLQDHENRRLWHRSRSCYGPRSSIPTNIPSSSCWRIHAARFRLTPPACSTSCATTRLILRDYGHHQQAAIEEMERRAFSVQAMHPIKDERARLRVAARYIKNGTVKFPRKGCERLLTQIVGFGSERFDDGVDAVRYLILGVIGDGIEEQRVHYV